MDNFEFFMYYLEVPAVLPDWKEGVTEDFTLEGKKFEDVVKKFKPGIYKQIRSNPHYTPPPGIAMFPGEMPRGPAALYQQTISISQLQGLQRVSPSVLANGRKGKRRSRSSVTKQYRSQYKRTNHRYCEITGKQIFPDDTSCLRDIRDQKKRDIYLPEMTCYGPCQYCGGWHKTSKVRGNPTPREIYDMMPFEQIGAVVSVVGLVGTVGKFIYEYVQAKRRKKREKEVDARLDNIVNAFNSLEAQLNSGSISRQEVETEIKRQIPENIRREVHKDLSERLTGVNPFAKEEERINFLMEIHPDKPSRVGLFIGAFGHEAHIAEMCKELEVAYIVDPQKFDVSKSKGNMKNWQSFKMTHYPGTLEQFLRVYETTSNKEPFSLVHFPHAGFEGDVTDILPYCTESTIFAGAIAEKETYPGATHVPMSHNAMPAVTRETRELLLPETPPTERYDHPSQDPTVMFVPQERGPPMPGTGDWDYVNGVGHYRRSFTGLRMPPMPSMPTRSMPTGTRGLKMGIDLDDLPGKKVEGPLFTDRERVSGAGTYREVRTKSLRVSGAGNRITGHVSDSVRLSGVGNVVEITVLPTTEIRQSGVDNIIKTNVVRESEFYKATRRNPRTKKGRKFPKKYLKNLTPTEKAIAMYEIDRGYEYDEDDPEAYKFWESDIKSKARGLKTVPSKWRNKFAKKYGPLKEGKDFLTRISKTTGIKRSILKKIYDKGLAAWRVGHRPGVQQHQWAAGRVYAFVMGADSSTGPGKPDHKLAVEAGVR